jgi:hypothetical protein
MNIYPYTNALILTEAIYTEYGGQSGSATAAQIQNAFLIAEQRVSKYVGTFLLPTIITGTFPYNRHQFIATDYGYVHEILSASLLSVNNLTTCTLRSDSGCVFIFDDTYGYLNYSCACSVCNCAAYQSPYQFQIAYRAGLPTGTASQAPFENALSIVAELALNEMVYPRANETPGDRGIEEFGSLDYREKRKSLKRTALGQSARANYAAELIDSCVKKARKALMMR